MKKTFVLFLIVLFLASCGSKKTTTKKTTTNAPVSSINTLTTSITTTTQKTTIESNNHKDIIISAYMEGSSNNKAIAIYNGTGQAVNLNGYKLGADLNLSSTPSKGYYTFGNVFIDNKQTIIICRNATNVLVIPEENRFDTYNYTFNGEMYDVIRLINDKGIVVDQIGFEPENGSTGNGEFESSFTKDHTLIRKSSILSPTPTTNWDEWNVYSKDYTSNVFFNYSLNFENSLLEEAKEDLTLGNLELITENFELPIIGLHDSTISWESNNSSITIDNNQAIVNRNITNIDFVLTATITLNNESITKTFNGSVLKTMTIINKISDINLNTNVEFEAIVLGEALTDGFYVTDNTSVVFILSQEKFKNGDLIRIYGYSSLNNKSLQISPEKLVLKENNKSITLTANNISLADLINEQIDYQRYYEVEGIIKYEKGNIYLFDLKNEIKLLNNNNANAKKALIDCEGRGVRLNIIFNNGFHYLIDEVLEIELDASTKLSLAQDLVESNIDKEIKHSVSLPYLDYLGVSLKEYSSSNVNYFDNNGNVNRTTADIPITLSYILVLDNVEYSYSMDLIVLKDVTVKEELEIHYINLGVDGDATLLKYGAIEILIDGGGTQSAGTNIIVPYLEKYVEDKLDYLIVTHADLDHIAGLVGLSDGLGSNDIELYTQGVFAHYEIENIVEFNYTHTSNLYQIYKNLLENENSKHYYIDELYDSINNEMMEFIINEDLVIEFLYNSYYFNNKADDNNDSVACLIRHGENKYLFTGDLEEDALNDLVKNNDIGNVDVLKAGHHGSKTAINDYFLSQINPKVIVISCGTNSKYSFPHQESLDCFYNYTNNVYATFLNGHIVITSYGNGYSIDGSINEILLHKTTWFINNRVYNGKENDYGVYYN